ITWMNGGKYPGMPFNQQMGFPVTLELRSTPEGPRLRKWPVKEMERLRETSAPTEFQFDGALKALPENLGDAADIELILLPGTARELRFTFRGLPVAWTAADQTLRVRDRRAVVKTEQGRLRLRFLLDRTSLETFAADGKVVFSDCFVPNPSDRTI